MYDRDHSQSSTQGDPWTEARKRREEWRAKRDARRAAWRAHLHGNGGWGHWGAWDDWGMGDGIAQPQQANAQIEALKAQVAGMTSTIETLAGRVKVLERLALERMAQDDEARLAAEIEKLRDADDAGRNPGRGQ